MTSDLKPAGFFVLRAPLLPFDEFVDWSTGSSPGDRLAAMLNRPDLLDALHVASPSLAAAVAGRDAARRERAVPAMVSYFTRLCTRPTPFGLFAGVTVGQAGEATCLTLPGLEGLRRRSRLDMEYLALLVTELEGDSEVRRLLTWSPNATLRRAGQRWHFVAGRLDGAHRSYDLVAVDDTAALAAVVERAGRGATVAELVRRLVDGGGHEDDAESFVAQIIVGQLLVSDLELRLTGDEPLDELITALGRHPHTRTASVAAQLGAVRSALAAIDAGGLGAAPVDYERVQALLPPVTGIDSAHLFQVDMARPASVRLGPAARAELRRAIDVLARLARPATSQDPLVRFRDAFIERYGDRWVAVAEALDPETGIGFGHDADEDLPSLVRGMPFEASPPREATFGTREAFLVAKLTAALEAGATEIVLDESDLDALASPSPPPLADALEVVATLAARSPESIDRGEFRLVVRAILGPPGVSLLGRFCRLDAELEQSVRDHLRDEEACRPAGVFAEIVHLPQGRAGNILSRPVLRRHEIPFLGRSGAGATAQIPFADLTVSVVAGRVRLWSQHLDREVVPRLTAAHDYTFRSLAAYHFLCALQDQGTPARLMWDWGPLASASFLPRVVSGRLVLARARWRLTGAEAQDVAGTRRARRLPRFVGLDDGDTEMVLDLDNPLSSRVLARRTAGATVVELYPGPAELCCAGPEGRFIHDLVVPFVRTAPPSSVGAQPATIPKPAPTPQRPVRRSFPPSSEWCYAKLYTGPATADRVLIDVVGALVEGVVRRDLAQTWFFVRYGDPSWHLRVRFQGDAGAILPLLEQTCAPALDDGRLWRVQLDTYEREVERYGGPEGIALSEQVFRHDSEAALALVRSVVADDRWKLALVAIDRMLSDLGFTPDYKHAWAARQRDAFGAAFGMTSALKGQLGTSFRHHRSELAQLLDADDGPILQRRSAGLRPLGAQLRAQGMNLGELAASYAHMHVNRMLRTAHRQQEIVIYEFLRRLYVARRARS